MNMFCIAGPLFGIMRGPAATTGGCEVLEGAGGRLGNLAGASCTCHVVHISMLDFSWSD